MCRPGAFLRGIVAIVALLSGVIAGGATARPAGTPAARASMCPKPWPAWQRFVERFVQPDGRVINADLEGAPTVSEGQAYALFFALVAGERARFGRLHAWTRDNLAAGDLTDRLPAWKWGRTPAGEWGVLDENSAADADLWIAYTLVEAGRLWNLPAYTAAGTKLAGIIARREVATLPGLGAMLLPGESGFAPAADLRRLNPSYAPLPLLRRLAEADSEGPWSQIAAGTAAMWRAIAPHGLAPDWVAWRTGAGFAADPEKGDLGSFDAIRTYLWAGLTDPGDPLRRAQLDALAGMERILVAKGTPPREVRATTGRWEGTGPAGFSAALVPYLRARGALRLARGEALRAVALMGEAPGARAPGYYDSVLALFGLGAEERRFHFDKRGRLVPGWRQSCEFHVSHDSHDSDATRSSPR